MLDILIWTFGLQRSLRTSLAVLHLSSVPGPPHQDPKFSMAVQHLEPPGGGAADLQQQTVPTAGHGHVRRSQDRFGDEPRIQFKKIEKPTKNQADRKVGSLTVSQRLEPRRHRPRRRQVGDVAPDPGPVQSEGVLEGQRQVAGLTSCQLGAASHWSPGSLLPGTKKKQAANCVYLGGPDPEGPLSRSPSSPGWRPWLEGLHGEAAAGRSPGARLEAESVLHVEGGDGEVGRGGQEDAGP